MKKFFQAVTPLIQNLSYESDTQRIERENVTGSIDFEKTRILRHTGSPNVVCIVMNHKLDIQIHLLNHIHLLEYYLLVQFFLSG